MSIAQHEWVWLIMRLTVAWVFLTPVGGLISEWESTKTLTRLVSGVFVNFLSVLSIAMMVLGAISILFGIYAQIGGILLLVYSVFGVRVHFKLAKMATALDLPDSCKPQGEEVFYEAKALATVGHVTSGQKNMIICAVSLAFVIMGSGLLSVTGNLW